MTVRMAKLDRVLVLVHALSESNEGLTLDEMADRVGVNRRTAERMRDIVALHFDLEEFPEDRRKRFRIRDSLRRVYTRPTPAEVAALQVEVDACTRSSRHDRASPLASLLAKVRSALDDRERRRLDPDFDALSRLQRTVVGPGPITEVSPQSVTVAQNAILCGCCLEFEYSKEDDATPQWRRVIPYGIVHGPVTYLIGKIPGSQYDPTYYRLDRMSEPRLSQTLGCPPDSWNIDDWLAKSFGIWRDKPRSISLLILPDGVARARSWRFHPHQTFEELADGSLRVRFSAGGLRELAEHLFHWAGELIIEEPQELRDVMNERLSLARQMTGDDLVA